LKSISESNRGPTKSNQFNIARLEILWGKELFEQAPGASPRSVPGCRRRRRKERLRHPMVSV